MGEARRPVQADDLFRIQMISDPAVSPDGASVAYAVTTMDREKNAYRSALWSRPLADGGEARQLTSGNYRDGAPAWSVDGRWLFFLSNRGGSSQIWCLPVDGGEPRKLTELRHGVESFVVAPAGSALALVAKVGPDDPDANDPRVIRSIRYRFNGEGYLGERYRQIWCLSADPNGDPAEPRQLTSGPYDHQSPSWSPTGNEIAFSAAREADWELSMTTDIWAITIAGGPLRKVTTAPGSWHTPVWSPDGLRIALTGPSDYQRADDADSWLWTVPAGGGAPEPLTSALNRSLGDHVMGDVTRFAGTPPCWSEDGASIYFQASDLGDTHLFQVDAGGKEITKIIGGTRRVSCVRPIPGGAGFVYGVSTPTSPGELFCCASDGSNERQLTGVNDEWLAGITMNEPEELWALSSDGTRVQGWLLRPPGSSPDVPSPMILEIHGGPHGQYGNGFMHEFQVLAGLGYAVLYCNPRGSTGYGEEFARKLHAAWGEADMPDLMACVEEGIKRGGIDAARLGVTGGSYGGIMTNWVIGHTDRFKAAVTQRCCSNYISMFGTDDISFVSSEMTFGAEFWDDPEVYWRLSPIAYVANMRTPLLILHSEEDYRCPMEQAEQLYTSLKVLRQTVEFMRFPNESHGLSRTGQPKHRLERLEAIGGWFRRYL